MPGRLYDSNPFYPYTIETLLSITYTTHTIGEKANNKAVIEHSTLGDHVMMILFKPSYIIMSWVCNNYVYLLITVVYSHIRHKPLL